MSLDNSFNYEMREATEEELESLVKKTEEYLPASYTVFSMLSIGFQRNIVDKSYTKIYVPAKEDLPLFVIIANVIRMNRNSMSPFWDPEEVSNDLAKRLLMSIPNWDWEEPLMVKAAPMENLRQLQEILIGENGLGNNKLKLHICGEGYTYKLPADANIKNKISDNFYLAPLEDSHAQEVFKHWKYNSLDSLEGVRHYMKSLPTMAAFTKGPSQDGNYNTKGKPISWAVCRHNGEIGFTFTYPEYRNKGLSRVVTCALADKLLQMGISPSVNISHENAAAIKTQENAGFRQFCSCGYHLYLKKNMDFKDF